MARRGRYWTGLIWVSSCPHLSRVTGGLMETLTGGSSKLNYTLLGKKQLAGAKFSLVPVGRFYLNHVHHSDKHGLPVLG
jgi:hypothetical protein